MKKRLSLIALLLLWCAVCSVPAQAQTVVNPKTVEFDPSADHSALTADNQPLVQRYDLEIFIVGAAQPATTASLGKPAPQADGKIRVDFSTLVTGWPLADGNYQARVAAIGPTGIASSDPSNTFAFQSCTITLGSASQSVPSGGATGNVTVNASSGCAWTATSNATWVVLGTTAATGAGTVGFTVTPNVGTTARAATLTIGGRSFTITQAAPAACSYGLSATTQTFTEVGGLGTVTVNTSSGCTWTATGGTSWVSLNTASGTGTGVVSFNVTANGGTAARTATLNVAGQPLTITQSAPVICSYTITPTSQAVAQAGGSGTVAVSAGNGCSWTATSPASWVTLGATGGTGSGGVSFAAAANTTTSARSATLTVAGRTFTVTQAGLPCSYGISPVSQDFTQAGGTGAITVTASAGCNWTAASGASWVTVSPASGGGGGTVSVTVAANTAASARSTTLTIGGQVFTVTQAAAPCSFALSAPGQEFPAAGGVGAVSVNASGGCGWTAAGGTAWVAVSPASGGGSGNVSVTVAANTAASARSTTLTIGGQAFTVTQAAAPCSIALSGGGQSFGSGGGAGAVTVTAGAGCAWAVASGASWLTPNVAGGTGGAVVSFGVAANNTTSPRTATLLIGGLAFTVTQAAMPCTYTLSSASQSFAATAGTGSVTLNAGAGCSWTATSNAAWATLTTASGNGTATVSFSLAANPDTAPRTATLTVGGQPFAVTQAAAPCTYALSAASQSFAQAGGSGSVSVTCGSSCSWTASSDATWVTLAVSAGSGSRSVSYTVTKNSSPTPRTATLTIGGKVLTVEQVAANRPTAPKKVRVSTVVGN